MRTQQNITSDIVQPLYLYYFNVEIRDQDVGTT